MVSHGPEECPWCGQRDAGWTTREMDDDRTQFVCNNCGRTLNEDQPQEL